jgi:hypothetical protein
MYIGSVEVMPATQGTDDSQPLESNSAEANPDSEWWKL